MRRSLGIAVAVLLVAGAGGLAFKEQIWPDTPSEPRRGAGGTAGDNLGKKRGGGQAPRHRLSSERRSRVAGRATTTQALPM